MQNRVASKWRVTCPFFGTGFDASSHSIVPGWLKSPRACDTPRFILDVVSWCQTTAVPLDLWCMQARFFLIWITLMIIYSTTDLCQQK